MRQVAVYQVPFTNIDKVLWPEDGYTKGDLIRYYIEVAPYMLPHLQLRPLVLTRHPDGIDGEWFYQKNAPEYTPPWIKTVRYEHKNGAVDYILAENPETLAWLANEACIEIHAWLSKITSPRQPELMVLDIDPMPPTGFDESVVVACETKRVLDAVGLQSWVKTSGATGLHIYVPIEAKYDYRDVVRAAVAVARTVETSLPELVTLERRVVKRGPKVYLDCYQNALGKTLAAPYSVRPRKNAPVSTPLSWDEVACKGPNGKSNDTSAVNPERFNIKTVPERLKEAGDPFAAILNYSQSLNSLLKDI